MLIKKCFPSLILVLVFSLSGCTGLNQGKSPDENPVIIQYGNLSVYKDDLTRKMNFYLTQQNMTLDQIKEDKDIYSRFKSDILFELSQNIIALKKASELGLDKLTNDEQAKIDQKYSEGISKAEKTLSVSPIFSKLDKNSSEYKDKLKGILALNGYNYDAYKEALKNELIVAKVKDYFTKDVSVTDEETKKEYDTELDIQKKSLESDPSSIESKSIYGAARLYYPPGYMFVKHILIEYDSAAAGDAAIAYTNGDMAECNKVITEATKTIQPRIDEVMNKLKEGANFDDLMTLYNKDNFFNDEPYKTNGFLIGPNSTFEIKEYITAIGSLSKAGQYTQPVPTYLGCFIIECVKPVAGVVPFDSVKDKLKSTMLQQRKDYTWSTLGQQWKKSSINDGSLKIYDDKV